MVVTEHPPFLRVPLPHKCPKICATRFIQESQTVGPMIETQLQRRLTGKAVGEVLANFLFWDRQAFNPEREKAFTAFTNGGAWTRFRSAVTIFGVLHVLKDAPTCS